MESKNADDEEMTMSAELVIAYLQKRGYYFSGFGFPVKDNTVCVIATFFRKPEGIKRENIHIIPEALPIADFVWEQYEQHHHK